jgi:hypothetical protein
MRVNATATRSHGAQVAPWAAETTVSRRVRAGS